MLKQNRVTTTMLDYLHLHNSISIPKAGNFGLPRSQMPQIESKYVPELLRFLRRKGVKVVKSEVATKSIMLVQNEYNRAKVATLMDRMRHHDDKLEPIFLSNDGFVLDGSHRLLAKYNLDRDSTIPAYVLDIPASNAVNLLNTFPNIRHRSSSDRHI